VKRIDGVDYFDDVLSGLGGVFEDSSALKSHESIQEKTTREGAEYRLECRMCSGESKILVNWLELFIISLNGKGKPIRTPSPQWKRSDNNGTMYVSLQCGRCGNEGYFLHITPEEAEKRVDGAIRSGILPRQQVQMWAQQIAKTPIQ
jgi:hypothetical protein